VVSYPAFHQLDFFHKIPQVEVPGYFASENMIMIHPGRW
jgi:hypothetical protein